MNSKYPHGKPPVFFASSHTQRGSSHIMVLGAIAILGLIGFLLLSLTDLSMFWKTLLLLAMLAAIVVAGVQVTQMTKRESDTQTALF